MHHVFYLDGNTQRISWIIQTGNSISEQSREHVEMYKDKISNLQSKYISLHVGLFWGIGIFKIKNKDSVKIKLDEKIMLEQLTTNLEIKDEFIKNRKKFIFQLISQRKLNVEFVMIEKVDNSAKKILDAKELKTKND